MFDVLKRNKKSFTAGAIALLLIATGGYYYNNHLNNIDADLVKASGTVEVQEVQIAPQVGGRILEMDFRASDSVKEGETLLKLSMDGADHDVARAQANLLASEHKYSELSSGFREEDKQSAKAQYEMRLVQYNQAKRDSDRFTKLAQDGVISERESELANQKEAAEKQALEIAKENLNKVEKGFRQEDIDQAAAAVKAARAALQKAETLVDYKTVSSPCNGVILSKNYEVGDVVGAGASVATLGKMDDLWIKLYIPATQLGLVKLGDDADVHIDAYPNKVFKGTVTEVSNKAEYNPRLSLTQSERANMVFWIKVSVKNHNGVLKPGMPADVVIK